MQSSNIFTVGGTLSANAHGRDLDVTQFVEVVQSFRLLSPSPQAASVSYSSKRRNLRPHDCVSNKFCAVLVKKLG